MLCSHMLQHMLTICAHGVLLVLLQYFSPSYGYFSCMDVSNNPLLCGNPPAGMLCISYNTTSLGQSVAIAVHGPGNA